MVIFHFTFPIYQFLAIPFNLIGIILMLGGLWINLWVSNYFKKVETTVKPFQVSTQLVTVGFYRYSRHPMYLGMMLLLLGIFLFIGSLSPIIIIPAYILQITRNFILPEEKILQETFGDAYKKHKKRVRCWI